jgi:anti-sigma B factor antagonist
VVSQNRRRIAKEVPVETAVGIFDSRERAEQAMKELLGKHVPQDCLVFLTRSETEAHTLGKEIGTYAGGFAGGAVGMAAGTAAVALALVPGVGQVFALGIGATALLGYLGARTGRAVGKTIGRDAAAPEPTREENVSEDAGLFIEVLKQGHSLIVVRTEFHDVARAASEVLDRLGLAMPGTSSNSGRMQTGLRQAEGVTVVDLEGKITFGEGTEKLREIAKHLLDEGRKSILLNLSQVDYIDSSGMGELVRSLATIRKNGGQMKLTNVNQKVQALLEATHLDRVFDIHKDEVGAVRAFGASGTRGAAS